ncbi:hypothetical protein MML48_5g00015384 [Holotrichia oblita]|uniref:Uncharacterized protein n=1 Tax=Holotrichia oblita TaxID=644536 RepID=A0ACB9T5W2_HOLOL|nr:hypothetical protein MML48_5g00015384 [Holotrichia oblita]
MQTILICRSSGETLTREQFEKRLAAVIEYLYPTFKPYVLASENLDIQDPFLKEMALRECSNRMGILAVSFRLQRLWPRPTDLGYYHWRIDKSACNDSKNYKLNHMFVFCRGASILAMVQLLLTLRFFATGNMLVSAADFVRVSKASGCRIVKRVSNVIASLSHEYIAMYTSNQKMETAAEKFYEIGRFRRVIGAIDCTLIRIQSPGGEDAEIFRCMKGFLALNVQTIVVRWPGSCYDQTIFNNSSVKLDLDRERYGPYPIVIRNRTHENRKNGA